MDRVCDFGMCGPTKTVYRKEANGSFTRTELVYTFSTKDGPKILDKDGLQVFPVPDETPPSTDEILGSCREETPHETRESAGGSKPERQAGAAIDLGAADFH